MTYVKNDNYFNVDNGKLEKLNYMLSADDTATYAIQQWADLDFP